MSNPYVLLFKDDRCEELLLKGKEKILPPLRFIFRERWYLSLMENACFEDSKKVKPLEEGIFLIEDGSLNRTTLIVYDKEPDSSYQLYSFKGELFNKQGLCIVNPFFEGSISIENGLLVTDSQSVFVNRQKVHEKHKLSSGDRISILGCEIIWYPDFIYTNSFMMENRLNKIVPDYPNFRYICPKNRIVKSNLNPILNIEEIKPFFFEYRKNTMGINQSFSSIPMVLTMSLISVFSILNGISNNLSLYQLIIYALMPLGMIVSLVLIPCFQSLSERNKEKKLREKAVLDYLDYLEKVKKRIIENLETYHNELKPFFFMNPEYRPVPLYRGSNLYSAVSLGFRKIRHAQSLPENTDSRITEKFNEIEEIMQESVPYMIQLTAYRTIAIVEKKRHMVSRMKAMIQELRDKSSSEDLKIMVYSRRKEDFEEILSLGHLVHSGKRMTFTEEKKVIEMDHVSFNEDVILFTLNPVSHTFTNPRIHCVVFTEEENSSLNSELVIDFSSKQKKAGDVFFDSLSFEGRNEWITSKDELYELMDFKEIGFHDFFSFDETEILDNYKEKKNGLVTTFATEREELFSLDIHESEDGPHGLIAGMTGSGKSELLVSLLLSLMVRYSPLELSLIIIDYKGGGITESFRYEDELPPHIIATCDNLENAAIERLLLKTSFLLRKRQILFKELSKKLGKPILNIDDYQDYAAMPHLMIVVDEFAELKKEHPEQMKELISYARIGRSLGLHLLLTTQKPAGNISEEILSNCSYRIALKTADAQDSRDILGSTEAAELLNPGDFVCLSKHHLHFGKAFYSRRDYWNGEKKKTALLNISLEPVKEQEWKTEETLTECQMALKSISSVSNRLGYKRNPLEFERSKELTVLMLKKKYQYKGSDLILGETDDYRNDRKELLIHPLNESALIISSSTPLFEILNFLDSEKTTVITEKKIDGFETVSINEKDDIEYLLRKLNREKERRWLVIENLSLLLDCISDSFETLLSILKRKQVTVYAFSFDFAFSQRILNAFSKRYTFHFPDHLKTQEFFASHIHSDSDSYFFEKEPIGFVPIAKESLKKTVGFLPYTDRIPEILNKEKGLIGIDLYSRKKIYVEENEKVRIVYEGNSFIQLKKYYDADFFEFVRTDELQSVQGTILYCGRSMANSRLFIPKNYRYEEGIAWLFRNGEIIRMKEVNHE